MKKQFLVLTCILMLLLLIHVSFALTQNEIVQLAIKQYEEKIPIEYRSEFPNYTIETNHGTVDTSYFIVWERQLNGIRIVGDRFAVAINEDGSFTNTGYFKYTVPANQLDTIPLITKDQANWIIQKNNWDRKDELELQIREGRLVWFGLVENCKVGIDAKTGNSIIYGCATESSISSPPVRFSPTQYFIETQMPWIIGILAAVGAGGVLYYRKLK